MIRPVESRDAAAITAIYNEYIIHTTCTFELDPLSLEDMQARIQAISRSYPYYVWEEDNHLLGYCYAHPWHERAAAAQTMESTIYLAPGSQGRNIGRQLMGKLIDDCRKAGYHALIASITAENKPSRAFHEHLGFVQVSNYREVGRKFGQWLGITDYELLLQAPETPATAPSGN